MRKKKGVESTLEITCGYALFGSNQIKSQYQINVPLACEVETETEGRSRRCPRSILLQVHRMLTAGLRRVPARAPHHLQIPSLSPLCFCVLSLSPNHLTTSRACCAIACPFGFAALCFRLSFLLSPVDRLCIANSDCVSFAITLRPFTAIWRLHLAPHAQSSPFISQPLLSRVLACSELRHCLFKHYHLTHLLSHSIPATDTFRLGISLTTAARTRKQLQKWPSKSSSTMSYPSLLPSSNLVILS